mmetsp:Transcript_30440/g.55239  ORF Transcript_30440/g.55239 Transcript_30440/m.55239 type:complete len:343 (+) Transcript_30440:196-1224(+)|eukprot:CAMPEP_0201893190 /NCGR_PEP_ID=MMETSP0902-20130614/38111_1 /ASSEMBLY_ACC=CAM_ASM_000551 /TAXON_ID=420261 /ORGANISM="Thalassiosira antarctica, Strain CCMP982" /LENGTH=342 /DNA_ID=CAMNT_0048424891 /DNA_START=96 /DNA_END=1127 /DNA_ORIENTATION=+
MVLGRTHNAGVEQRSGALAIGTVVATVAALIILTVLIVWTAIEDQDDGGIALKIVLNLLVLVIACGILFVPMKKGLHPPNGLYDTFNLGVLAASTFLFGNMLFVSVLSLVNLGYGEEENDTASRQKVVSFVSLVLALVFSALSVCIYYEGKRLPACPDQDSNGEKHVQVKSAAHMEILSQMWTILSSCTLISFSGIFIIACVLSGIGEDAERMREDGIINLIIVLLWMIVVTTGIMILGRKILNEKKLGSLGVGMLSGGTMYFAMLLFMVFLLYANLTSEEREEEVGFGPQSATLFACLFLSMLYLAFSLGAYRYQKSIIGAISAEKDTVSGLKRVLFFRKK